MTNPIKPQPGILDIDLYVGGHSTLPGVTRVVKLSSNENPLGPSPKAIAAFQAAAGSLGRYPSSDHSALRSAIAKRHSLDAERIICGAGSDEVIAFLCQAYAGPGDEVIYTEHGFAMYKISAQSVGATPVKVKETSRTTDVDGILAACNSRTKLVFIANPNNPTGTMISTQEVARLAAGLPDQALLVLDGAYGEFVEDFDAGAGLVDARQNVVMTRTFSKIYGLGSLRVGWGYGPGHVIDVLNRIRGPFNVSAAGLAAAEAAVNDVEYLAFCQAENKKWRDWLQAELAAIGLPSAPAFGNFVVVDFASIEMANACDDFLKTKGIIVRKIAGYDLPKSLRITVGDADSCHALMASMRMFVKGRV